MHVFFLLLTVLMALVMFFDVTKYLIPNWLVGLVLVFYPFMVLMAPHGSVNWLGALGAMLVIFAVGYVIYIKKWMGGGDIKLLTACALWAGPMQLLDFLLIMALIGGALALLLIAIRRALPWAAPAYAGSAKLPRVLSEGEPLPYGLAIAGSFLLLLWMQQLPGLALH